MTEKHDSPEQQERAARRAEALRANLRRRKVAARKDAAPRASDDRKPGTDRG